jgi:hypothetical protein
MEDEGGKEGERMWWANKRLFGVMDVYESFMATE